MINKNYIKRPDFTRKEEEAIIEQIDDWYLDWKKNIIDKETRESYFPSAYADLTRKILPISSQLNKDQIIFIYNTLQVWFKKWQKSIVSQDRNSHRLGYAKNLLIYEICDCDPLTGEKNAN